MGQMEFAGVPMAKTGKPFCRGAFLSLPPFFTDQLCMRMFVRRFGVKTGMCHKQKYGPGFYAEPWCMAVVNLKPTQFYGPVFGLCHAARSQLSVVLVWAKGKPGIFKRKEK